jgi:hypothetical protein
MHSIKSLAWPGVPNAAKTLFVEQFTIQWPRELHVIISSYSSSKNAHCRWRNSTGKPDIGFECYCWIVVVMETAMLEFLNNLGGLGTE